MKKTLRSLLFIFGAMLTVTASAQLPDGSIAPDFTITDLDGNEWNLYDILDEGKQVIIDFSATWCGPCWSYHEGGALETIWEQYGPEGTDEVMVFYIEGDASTTIDDLNGTGGNTQGDWVTGTGYPIADDAAVSDLYAVGYFPTIYTICPNRVITESGQASVADHVSIFQDDDCGPAALASDPTLLSYNGPTAACSDVDVEVSMMNFGVEELTSATIQVYEGGESILSYDWTGSLSTYEIANVVVGTIQIDDQTDITVEITSENDNTSNDMVEASIASSVETTTHIQVNILTDFYSAGENGWEIKDQDGNVVASAPLGSLAPDTQYNEDIFLPASGCYSFELIDTYGDGLNGAAWGYTDGNAYILSYDGDGNIMQAIYENDGSVQFGSILRAMDAATVVGVEENETLTSLNVFPNPTSDIANLVFGVAEASEVSIDVFNIVGAQVMNQDLGTVVAGEQRVELNFGGLEAGLYIINVTANGNVSTMRVTLTK